MLCLFIKLFIYSFINQIFFKILLCVGPFRLDAGAGAVAVMKTSVGLLFMELQSGEGAATCKQAVCALKERNGEVG